MDSSPIKSVNGITNLPCPTSYTPDWEDVSRPSAGRTEDGVMHPEKIGTARSFSMEWQNIPFDDASRILKAYTSAEQFPCTLFDLERGEKNEASPEDSYFVTDTYYVGNRNAPVYNMTKEIVERVSFKIVSIGIR